MIFEQIHTKLYFDDPYEVHFFKFELVVFMKIYHAFHHLFPLNIFGLFVCFILLFFLESLTLQVKRQIHFLPGWLEARICAILIIYLRVMLQFRNRALHGALSDLGDSSSSRSSSSVTCIDGECRCQL